MNVESTQKFPLGFVCIAFPIIFGLVTYGLFVGRTKESQATSVGFFLSIFISATLTFLFVFVYWFIEQANLTTQQSNYLFWGVLLSIVLGWYGYHRGNEDSGWTG